MTPSDSRKIAVLFFGTHDFGAAILKALIESGRVLVKEVITQPDRPVGRTQELQAPPVKMLAQSYDIAVSQYKSLASYTPTTQDVPLAIATQYGALIPKHILDAFPFGILNVHPSLLPQYRGASPIQSALLHGDTKTGVTIMKLDEGMDTGPIFAQKTLSIAPDDTYATLEPKLAALGAELLLETILAYLSGAIAPQPQDDARATHCTKIKREDGRIDWSHSAQEIYNQFRAYTPWPGIWTTWNGTRLKLLDVHPKKKTIPPGEARIVHDTLQIGCGSGSFQVDRLQKEGKKPVSVEELLLGNRDIDGAQLGT